MAQMTSGKVLAEARERKGYDIGTVARRLRIRPDILRAIEAGDFSAMPPRGYTRNMVNAYARLLGLNPTEIVDMYLDEAYANQVKRARSNAPSSRFNMERDTVLSRRVSREAAPEEDQMGTSSVRSSYLARDLYDDRTRFSRDDYGLTREGRVREGRSDRDFLSHHSGYPSSSFSFMDERGGRFSRNRGIQVGSTPMSYSASRLPSFMQGRGTLIVAALLLIVIVVAIVLLVIGNRNTSDVNDVNKLNVTGINDTTQTGEEAEGEAPVAVAVAPTSAKVSYKATGPCYIEVYDNSSSPQGIMLEGTEPETAFEVVGTWTITTYAVDNLTLIVDGEEKQLELSDEYGGMYSYKVDFVAMLETWFEEHPEISSNQRATALAAAQAAKEEAEAAAQPADTDQSGYYEESYDNGGDTYYDESAYTEGGDYAYTEDGTVQY